MLAEYKVRAVQLFEVRGAVVFLAALVEHSIKLSVLCQVLGERLKRGLALAFFRLSPNQGGSDVLETQGLDQEVSGKVG